MKRDEGKTTEERRRLYTAIIGDQSTDYYLEVFEEFDRNGGAGAIPNPGAAFGVGLWFFWRRLWLPGLFYLVYAAIVLLLILLAISEVSNLWQELGASAPTKAIGIFKFLGMLLLILYALGAWLVSWQGLIFGILFTVASYPLVMANALYYRYCNRRIEEALTKYRKLEIAERALSKDGGVSYAGVVVGTVLMLGLTNIGWTKLHQKENDAEFKQLVEKVHRASPVLLNMIGYRYLQTGEWEVRKGGRYEPGIQPLPGKVLTIQSGERSGDYVLVLSGGKKGKALIYSPLIRTAPDYKGGEKRSIEWKCVSRGFDAKMLPSSCRDLQ